MRQAVEGDFGKLTITEDRAPTDGERRFLVARRAALIGALQPAGADALAVEIVAMFSTMRSKTVEADELAAVIGVYSCDLAALPFFAVKKACSNFRTGAVGDGVWLPTQGEIANEARRIMRDAAEEKAIIDRVLSARVVAGPPNPQRRAELAAKARAMLASAVQETTP